MPKITWFRQQKILTIKFKFSSIRTSKIFTHESTNVEMNMDRMNDGYWEV